MNSSCLSQEGGSCSNCAAVQIRIMSPRLHQLPGGEGGFCLAVIEKLTWLKVVGPLLTDRRGGVGGAGG